MKKLSTLLFILASLSTHYVQADCPAELPQDFFHQSLTNPIMFEVYGRMIDENNVGWYVTQEMNFEIMKHYVRDPGINEVWKSVIAYANFSGRVYRIRCEYRNIDNESIYLWSKQINITQKFEIVGRTQMPGVLRLSDIRPSTWTLLSTPDIIDLTTMDYLYGCSTTRGPCPFSLINIAPIPVLPPGSGNSIIRAPHSQGIIDPEELKKLGYTITKGNIQPIVPTTTTPATPVDRVTPGGAHVGIVSEGPGY